MSASRAHRAEIVEVVRGFLLCELLRDPGLALAEDEPLLASGLVSSFDLVAIGVFLERRFGLALPDAALARERLDTLGRIADLVLTQRGEEAGKPQLAAALAPDPIALAMPSFRRAPVAVSVGILLGLTCVELIARLLVSSPAILKAVLDPDTSRLSYDFLDYEEALSHHDLTLVPRSESEIRIVFVGDSGTAGTFLSAQEACPAIMGQRLLTQDPDVRVYNVSYFGQSLVKDAAFVEAIARRKPDIVVLSISSTQFDRAEQQDCLVSRQKSVAWNRHLFHRFVESTGKHNTALEELDATLSDRARSQGFGPEELFRVLGDHSALVRNRLIFQRGLREFGKQLIAPRISHDAATTESVALIHTAPSPHHRYAGKTTAELPPARPLDFDARQSELLELIVDRVRSVGAEVVLFLEPIPKIRGSPPRRIPWDEAGWQLFDNAIAAVRQRKNLDFVDARDTLEQEEFLDTDHHWSGEGNRALGELLAKEVAPVLARLRRRQPR